MKNLIEKYLEKGVYQNKIIETKQPSVCVWSLSRKCLVGENFVGFDNDIKNNRIISLPVHDKLTSDMVEDINDSAGIIITEYEPYFRYEFIPISEFERLKRDRLKKLKKLKNYE